MQWRLRRRMAAARTPPRPTAPPPFSTMEPKPIPAPSASAAPAAPERRPVAPDMPATASSLPPAAGCHATIHAYIATSDADCRSCWVARQHPKPPPEAMPEPELSAAPAVQSAPAPPAASQQAPTMIAASPTASDRARDNHTTWARPGRTVPQFPPWRGADDIFAPPEEYQRPSNRSPSLQAQAPIRAGCLQPSSGATPSRLPSVSGGMPPRHTSAQDPILPTQRPEPKHGDESQSHHAPWVIPGDGQSCSHIHNTAQPVPRPPASAHDGEAVPTGWRESSPPRVSRPEQAEYDAVLQGLLEDATYLEYHLRSVIPCDGGVEG